MPNKEQHPENKETNSGNAYRYKRGKVEIESKGDNRAAQKTANIDTVFYWLLRLAAAYMFYRALH